MDDDNSTISSNRSPPLEKAMFRFDGAGPDRGKEIPALDPRWCNSRQVFPKYVRLLYDTKIHVRPWLQNCQEIVDACKWLLAMPYHKFWSQVVYGDKSFRVMIDSYLSLCPRFHDVDEMKMTFFSSRNPKIKAMMDEVYASIFFVILRMATAKEASRLHYMHVEVHGKLILDYRLFDIPRLVDISVVYGFVNDKLVKRMFEIILKNQPKFYDQMKEFTSGFMKIFAKIEHDIERVIGRKVRILRKVSGKQDERISENILRYMTDLVLSIAHFAKVCPKALEYYHLAGLTNVIPRFVEQTIADMLQDLYDRDLRGGFRTLLNELIGRLGAVRSELVTLWRSMLEHNVLDRIKNAKSGSKASAEDASQAVDEMLGCLTNCLEEKTFLRLYASQYPLSHDIDDWITHRIELDMDRVQYISDAISSSLDLDVAELPISNQVNTRKDIDPTIDETKNIYQSMIAQFCELFPDFDAAQALTILQHYDGDAENAINAVLTGNLPADCPQLPKEEVATGFSTAKASGSSATIPKGEDSLVPLRESSKRGTGKIMENKSVIDIMKPFYERYQMETEENEWEALDGVKPLNARLPKAKILELEDDEYDDTYDAQDVDLDVGTTTDEKVAAAKGQSAVQHPSGDRGAPYRADSEGRQFHRGGPRGGARGASRPYRGNYTGGRERQEKERNKGRDQKFLAMKKHSKGFGFY